MLTSQASFASRLSRPAEKSGASTAWSQPDWREAFANGIATHTTPGPRADQARWQHGRLVEPVELLAELHALLPRLNGGQGLSVRHNVEAAFAEVKGTVASLRAVIDGGRDDDRSNPAALPDAWVPRKCTTT